MKIVVATDSFKGCLTSTEAGAAVRAAVTDILPQADVSVISVSDGGEGMLFSFINAMGGQLRQVSAHDAMMRPIMAQYGVKGGVAVIEAAQACGLTLIEPDARNAVAATSWGVGEILADAILNNCTDFIIGLGGTATTDGGIGMLRALVSKFAPQGGNYDTIRQKLCRMNFTIASDVDNKLCGVDGAACVYAPQKGASPADVLLLEKRLSKFAAVSARHFGFDRSSMAGAGAAGGLGYAFLQYFNATMRPGAELLFDLLKFDSILSGASLIITGEGRSDRQTLMGKLPYRVMKHAQRQGVPVLLLCGAVDDSQCLRAAGFSSVVCITPPTMPLEEALKPETAICNIRKAVSVALKSYS